MIPNFPFLNEDIIGSILKNVHDDPLDASTDSDDDALAIPYKEEDLANIMKKAVDDVKCFTCLDVQQCSIQILLDILNIIFYQISATLF